jgi:hypothetical protein
MIGHPGPPQSRRTGRRQPRAVRRRGVRRLSRPSVCGRPASGDSTCSRAAARAPPPTRAANGEKRVTMLLCSPPRVRRPGCLRTRCAGFGVGRWSCPRMAQVSAGSVRRWMLGVRPGGRTAGSNCLVP